MKTQSRPQLKTPVLAFARKLQEGPERIPLTELAGIFGAPEEVRDRIAGRGDIVFKGDTFTNDGPELTVPAGSVELEIPSLMRGTWSSDAEGFRLTFGREEFALAACATLGFIRKCFALREMRATRTDVVLDFGNAFADRRYTF